MRLRPVRRRTGGSLVVVAAVTLVLAGCTQVESGAGSVNSSGGNASSAPRQSPTASPSNPAASRARFSDCADDFNLGALTFPAGRRDRLSFDCAAIQVPSDYSDPSGQQLSIQLVRVHDERNTSGRQLLLNPGGPGGSGVELALGLSPRVSDTLLAHYDLLGFDPRGVGSSSPIRCVSNNEKDKANAAQPDVRTQAGFDEAKGYASAFAKACSDKYGNALADFDTVNTARDMDQIRKAVGEDKLNYLGFSYGTELGAQYAHLFPKNIRVMVLDGAVDPLTSDITAFANQLQGFEDAFDQFASWCTSHNSCKSLGNPREAVYNIANQARRAPIPSGQSNETRKATSSLVYTGILSALYSQSEWPTLGTALINAQSGRSEGLLQLADSYLERYDGQYSNIADANATISCNDSKPGPTDTTIRTTAASWVKKFPMFGLWSAASLFQCQQWQPKRTVPALPTAPGASQTVLVVGNLHDPATPYQGAKNLTKVLGKARLLSWNGQGHTSYLQGSSCVDQLVDAYLDSGALPPNGKVCPP